MVIILVRKATAGKAEPRPADKGLTGRPGTGNGRHTKRYIPLSPCPLRLRWRAATQGRTATPAKGFYKCFSVSSLCIFSGQGFVTPPGLVVMPLGTQNRHQTSNRT